MERNATAAEAAAMEFEPWTHAPGEWTPPTNDEWAAMTNPYLVTVRFAWVMLYKTKGQVAESITGLEDEAGRALMDAFTESLAFFQNMVTVLAAAEARILVAGATLLPLDGSAVVFPRTVD